MRFHASKMPRKYWCIIYRFSSAKGAPRSLDWPTRSSPRRFYSSDESNMQPVRNRLGTRRSIERPLTHETRLPPKQRKHCSKCHACTEPGMEAGLIAPSRYTKSHDWESCPHAEDRPVAYPMSRLHEAYLRMVGHASDIPWSYNSAKRV